MLTVKSVEQRIRHYFNRVLDRPLSEAACAEAGVPATARQASKYRRACGAAFNARQQASL